VYWTLSHANLKMVNMPLIPLGVDLGGTKLLILAETPAGERTWKFPTGPGFTPADFDAHLAAVGAELAPAELVYGLSVPGLVNDEGVVGPCDVLPLLNGWRPRAAAALNDGQAALTAYAAGCAPGATLAIVGSGTAIAAALQIAGHRVPCTELGYVPYGPEATLDAAASGAALLAHLALTAPELAERLSRHDPVATAAVRAAGEAFGAGIAALINLFRPERIGLYGGTLTYLGYLTAALAAVDRRALPALRPSCRVELVPQPELIAARGALLAVR
jgi:predicted NBD/HSP70 family sugar kinase